MKWSSDLVRRSAKSGVLLIEALIGVALLASVIVAGLATLSYATRTEAERRGRIWLAEFARSKAEEYTTTYPLVPSAGTEAGGWSWRIAEARVRPDGESPFERDIALFEIQIDVWNDAAPTTVYSGTTLMARRP